MPKDEVEKTVRSATEGASQAKLVNARRDLSLTSGGFAERLLEADADQLLLARYQAKDGRDKTEPYLLQPNALWRRDFDALRYRLDRIVDEVVVEEHKAGRLTQRIVTKTQRMREKDAAEALGRLGVAAKKWADGENPLLSKVVRCGMEDLDSYGRFLGCTNGVVDLQNGEIVKPIKARHYRVSQSTGVAYNPTAHHEAVDALTAHLDPELAAYVWALFGRMMWAEPLKRVVLMVGPPNSGKSTLLRAVGSVLGEDSAGASADIFVGMKKDGGKTGPTPARAVLALCRFVYCIEASSWKVDTEVLKNAAGEIDTITYELKYGPIVSRPLRASIFIMGNDYPTLDWFDEALVDRLITIPFPLLPHLDNKVTRAVKEDEFKQALLARLVRCAVENPVGTEPAASEAVGREKRARIDKALGALGVWLRENLVQDLDGRLTKKQLWEAWAREWGADPSKKRIAGVGNEDCARDMRRVFGIDPTRIWVDGKTAYGWKGVRLETEGSSMGADPMRAHVVLKEAVEAKQAAAQAELEALPHPLEELETALEAQPHPWPAEFEPPPLDPEELAQRYILSRQVFGLDRLLNAIRMMPADSLLTHAELDVWGGPQHVAEDLAVVFAHAPTPLAGFDYARLLLDAKRHARKSLEGGPFEAAFEAAAASGGGVDSADPDVPSTVRG